MNKKQLLFFCAGKMLKAQKICDKCSGKKCVKPCLEPTTSKRVENTKAFEWTIIKELGKLTHVTSGEGGPFHLISIRLGRGGTEWCCTTV